MQDVGFNHCRPAFGLCRRGLARRCAQSTRSTGQDELSLGTCRRLKDVVSGSGPLAALLTCRTW